MTPLDLHAIVAVGLGIGLVTLAFRLAFAGLGRRPMPGGVRAILAWVPVAALAAIVAPALLGEPGTGSAMPSLIAALVAGGVAYRTRNLLLSVALGMATYWLALA